MNASPLTHPDFHRPGLRFGVALAFSVAAHLVLLFALKVAPSASPDDTRGGSIQVQLMDVSLPQQVAVPEVVAVATVERSPVAVSVERRRPVPPREAQEVAPPSLVSTPAPSPAPGVELPLAEDPAFYPSAQLDVHPVALRKIQPVYPKAATDAGIRGKVTLLLHIDEYGVVQDVWINDADPEGWFEESAVAAIQNVRFRPAERKGRAVKSQVLIRVGYELND